jgi:hypothetical protein
MRSNWNRHPECGRVPVGLLFVSFCCCLRDLLGFKREQGPALAAVLDTKRLDRLTRKHRDGFCPKMLRRNVRLHDANLPQSREPPPHFMRRSSSNAASPASTQNEKLRHIPNHAVARDSRPSLDKNQPGQFAIHPDKKRMPVRLRPIKRKGPVAEPAILSDIQTVEFAKIVCVQLNQVRQDRLLLRRGGDNFEVRGCPLALGHSLRGLVFRSSL